LLYHVIVKIKSYLELKFTTTLEASLDFGAKRVISKNVGFYERLCVGDASIIEDRKVSLSYTNVMTSF
jgi:uncharacterized protein Veg